MSADNAVTGRRVEFPKLFTKDSCGGHAGGRRAKWALQFRDCACVFLRSLLFTTDESIITTRGDIYSVLAVGRAQRWAWFPCSHESLKFHHNPMT